MFYLKIYPFEMCILIIGYDFSVDFQAVKDFSDSRIFFCKEVEFSPMFSMNLSSKRFEPAATSVRDQDAKTTTSNTQGRDKIFKLTPIHASLI